MVPWYHGESDNYDNDGESDPVDLALVEPLSRGNHRINLFQREYDGDDGDDGDDDDDVPIKSDHSLMMMMMMVIDSETWVN